jgi:hypothetical protein
MTPPPKFFCTKVKSFYTDELVYHDQFKPDPSDLNQVYFPVCLHHLDVDGLLTWLKDFDITEELFEWLDISLFNKDKETIFNHLTTQPQEVTNVTQSSLESFQTLSTL